MAHHQAAGSEQGLLVVIYPCCELRGYMNDNVIRTSAVLLAATPLRQRTGFALSQIYVLLDCMERISSQPEGLADYGCSILTVVDS